MKTSHAAVFRAVSLVLALAVLAVRASILPRTIDQSDDIGGAFVIILECLHMTHVLIPPRTKVQISPLPSERQEHEERMFEV